VIELKLQHREQNGFSIRGRLLTYFTGGLGHQTFLATANNTPQLQCFAAVIAHTFCRSVAASRWRYTTSQPIHLLLSGRWCFLFFFGAGIPAAGSMSPTLTEFLFFRNSTIYKLLQIR